MQRYLCEAPTNFSVHALASTAVNRQTLWVLATFDVSGRSNTATLSLLSHDRRVFQLTSYIQIADVTLHTSIYKPQYISRLSLLYSLLSIECWYCLPSFRSTVELPLHSFERNNMHISLWALLGLVPLGAIAKDAFEPADFNVKDALLKNGVDVADLPELSQLGKRSSMSRCGVAVSNIIKTESWTNFYRSAALFKRSSMMIRLRFKQPTLTRHLPAPSGPHSSKRLHHNAYSSLRQQSISLL